MATILTTDRLRLRTVTPADAEDLLALHTDAEVMRFLGDPAPATQQLIENTTVPHMSRHYPCLGGPAYFAAEERDSGRFVGWFELRPVDEDDAPVVELGYRLNKAAWGRGYATEGARALVHRAFAELGVEQVFAETMTVNTPSRRVMEKTGLRHVRTFHEDWPDPLPGSEHGEVEYALTRAEWRAEQGSRDKE